MNKEQAAALDIAARRHVHQSVDDFVKQYAAEFTVGNLGQEAVNLFQRFGTLSPSTAFWAAYSTLASESASEGLSIDDEYRYWAKEARKVATKLVKKGLPLTVENGTSLGDGSKL